VGNGKFWANEGTRLPRNFRTGDKILNPPIRTQGERETGRRVGMGRVGESFPHWRASGRKLERVQTPYADMPLRRSAS
jgi:hypothetical protein